MAISNLNRSVDQFQSISLNWEEVVYGDYGLSLELPIKLEEFELRVPIQQASLVKEIQAYNSDPKAEISAMVITTLFDKSIGSVNVQASISGFIAQIQKMPGISRFKVQQGETTLSGIVGFEQKGSFLISGQAKVFRSIGVSKGLILWQVMVVCNEDNEVLLEAMDRIFNSIEILYNTGV